MEIKLTTDDLVTVDQAAESLGKHRATIYRWMEKGMIAFVNIAGTSFIPKTEIERLQASPPGDTNSDQSLTPDTRSPKRVPLGS